MAKKSQKASNDVDIQEALEKFRNSQEASDFNRDNYYEDVKFSRLSEQWPEDIKKQREQEGRPALVVNKLPAMIRSVVNEARQNTPGIKVSPVDSGADEDTAEIISGLMRSVQDKSAASVAYDTAIDHAVTGGMGFFRIDIDYAHDESFDLEARINRIANPLSVHWDTSSERFDAADWGFCFVSDFLDKDEYEVKYPGASTVPFDGSSNDENSDLWIQDETIRVAEYFNRIPRSRKLLQLSVTDEQGQQKLHAVREDELPAMAKRFFEAGMIPTENMSDKDLISGFMEVSGVQVLRERDVEYFDVKRQIINGVEVLEEDMWPGTTIPVCPVWGDEVYLNGRRHFRSLIRDVKDSQMMFNFWRSASTEIVALAPKAPFIGPKGFIPKGQEQKWASANNRSHAYLEYAGNMGPQRQPFPGVPAGMIQESVNASSDMQDVTGIYPSALGAKSNETSGKAILARERQGDTANFHFIDNLNRAIEYAGRVLVEIIPSVYSPRETVRILGEDKTAQVVQLTQEDGGSLKPGIDGQKRLYNLAVGKYDVTVSSGPSFATQREETRETLIEIMRAVPQAANFVGDVLLDHMDFVGADKVAKRLKALLPPEVRQAEDAEINSDNPELAAKDQEIKAMQQQMQQAQQAIMQEIETIKKENEALKQSKAIEAQRLQMDAQYKGQELALKDRELKIKEAETFKDKPEPTYQEQWEYDRANELDKLAFEAAEAEKDRELEREKIFLQNAPQQESDAREASSMDNLATILAAPKEVIRDEQTGQVIGVKPVLGDVEND